MANRQPVMDYIAAIIKKYPKDKYPNVKFHFTGHSLGGGLAQYFAYEYAKKYLAGKPEDLRPPDSLTVTTFNCFGAEYGLREIFKEEPDFTVVKDLKIQCFFAINDLVSRIGGRHLGPTFRPSFGYQVLAGVSRDGESIFPLHPEKWVGRSGRFPG